ncbi:CD1247 N-terminal domain-containing protein [Thermoflavimicrobium dichotomicum]|uniref:MJ0042 family finger-like domain-containing protein n=1 Tax=Thermoflavimicrobium dichotomicum TaxID=46223 RepID=A0A1I3QBL9_9BACL|nr:CD1247 N-terminal domain-containing protein [Thermoflavimicrobium dichotomicum]SFJ31533.1 MJ0042 family finger-like domain-containing protein [Thermoflavimicrobium dichotomicum]
MYERLRRELAYVRGLCEGNPELDRKALNRLLDTLDELVEANQHVEARLRELEEYVEEVDEDLNELELAFYGDLDDEEGLIEVVCPECGEEVLVDEDDIADDEIEVLCPKCHTVLVVEDATEIEPQRSGVDETIS